MTRFALAGRGGLLCGFLSALLTGCSSVPRSEPPAAVAPPLPEIQESFPELPQGEVEKLTKVATYWVSLLDAGSLPGLSKDDHGECKGYQLTKDLQRECLRSKALTTRMVSDLRKADGSPYLWSLVTTNHQHFYYFFSLHDSQGVSLTSAYHFVRGQWVKLRLPEEEKDNTGRPDGGKPSPPDGPSKGASNGSSGGVPGWPASGALRPGVTRVKCPLSSVLRSPHSGLRSPTSIL